MTCKSFVLSALAACLFASCSSTKPTLPYFIDLAESKSGTLDTLNYLADIQPDDELSITINSQFPEATAMYNIPLTNVATRGITEVYTTNQIQTYIVDTNGDIDMPVLGKIHAAGRTVEELEDYLTEVIRADVSDAIVKVQQVNFYVVVAGEVSHPTRLRVSGNRFSILDAITSAGDLTPYGVRDNILIIRENNGERTYTHLDLTSSEILTSPYFYLQPNDYIYVEPNEIRQANSRYNQDNAYKLTVISTIVSAASVIASLVIALTVK